MSGDSPPIRMVLWWAMCAPGVLGSHSSSTGLKPAICALVIGNAAPRLLTLRVTHLVAVPPCQNKYYTESVNVSVNHIGQAYTHITI